MNLHSDDANTGGGTEINPTGQCERRMRVCLWNEMLIPGQAVHAAPCPED